MTLSLDDIRQTPVENQNLYQKFTGTDEISRLAYHYSQPPNFFTILTGGEWNTYSASIFEGTLDITQAQEDKLDVYAKLTKLKPGMRILDIGSGWGGPLVYLCKKYDVVGVGVSVAQSQVAYSKSRAAIYDVNSDFVCSHWRDFDSAEKFDAIITDESTVHVHDFNEFFQKCGSLLKPKGILVNKELHLSSTKFKDWSDPIGVYVNLHFGFTGNYRTVSEEIRSAQQSQFTLLEQHDVDISHYMHTIQAHWVRNLLDNRQLLSDMTSPEHVREFYKMLRCCLVSFRKGVFELNYLAFENNH